MPDGDAATAIDFYRRNGYNTQGERNPLRQSPDIRVNMAGWSAARRNKQLTGKQVRILCSAAAVIEESDTKSHWRVCAGKAYQAVTLKPEDLKMSMRGYAP